MLQGPIRQHAEPGLVEYGQGGSRAGAVQDHGRSGAVEVVGVADSGAEVLHEHAEPAIQDGGGINLRDGNAERVR